MNLESMFLRKWIPVYTCFEAREAHTLIENVGISHLLIDEQFETDDLSKWLIEVQSLFPHLCIIGLADSKHNCFSNLPIDSVLQKPFSPTEILAKLRKTDYS